MAARRERRSRRRYLSEEERTSRRRDISGQVGLSPDAQRQRRRRQRDRRGIAVLAVEVNYYKLVSAILRNGSLTEAEALSKENVARIAGRMIEEVIALWL